MTARQPFFEANVSQLLPLPYGAFIALVVDGTRSIAASATIFTSLNALIETSFPGRIALLRRARSGLHPWLGDPLVLTCLKMPAFLWLLACGLILAVLSRPPVPLIGTSSRA